MAVGAQPGLQLSIGLLNEHNATDVMTSSLCTLTASWAACAIASFDVPTLSSATRDTTSLPALVSARVWIELLSAGTAWVDLVQLVVS